MTIHEYIVKLLRWREAPLMPMLIGGTYTLTTNGKTTKPIAYDATRSEVEAALDEISDKDDQMDDLRQRVATLARINNLSDETEQTSG